MIGVIALVLGGLSGWMVVAFLVAVTIGRAVRLADWREARP